MAKALASYPLVSGENLNRYAMIRSLEGRLVAGQASEQSRVQKNLRPS